MNYLRINEFCQTYLPDLTGAELSGMLHGLIGHGYVPEQGRWPQQMSDYLANGQPLGQQAEEELEQILAFSQKDYQPESFTIDLMIPEDDYPLQTRAKALGEWCQGYLTGYGLIKQEKELEDDAKEALQDLSEISKIEFELSDEDLQELEKALETICEHVKMAAQLIFQSVHQIDDKDIMPEQKQIH